MMGKDYEDSELVKAVGLLIDLMTAEERNAVFENLKRQLTANADDISRLLRGK